MSALENITVRSGCQCGGSCHSKQTAALAPHELLTKDFSAPTGGCACSKGGRACPRHYIAISGLVLSAFLISHLALNALGLWPGPFQFAVNSLHKLGIALPVLELNLLFMPLVIHIVLATKTLRREKLKFGGEKHHHGSDLRNWLQRVTALILLAFLAFHVLTMSQWGLHLVYRLTNWQALSRYAESGLFDPARAFESVRAGVGSFWGGGAGNPMNLLVAQFYLLGIAAAIFHMANGVATGAEVLGFTKTEASQRKAWQICILAGLVIGAIGLLAWYAMTIK